MPSNDNPSAISRRDFIVVLTKTTLALSSLLGLGGIVRFLSAPSQESPPTQFDLGPADQFPPGTRRALPEVQAIVLHGSQGVVAFSTLCPHLGCSVNDEGSSFSCPCHGSLFDAGGRLIRGPAKSDLRKLRIEVNEQGNLNLYTN